MKETPEEITAVARITGKPVKEIIDSLLGPEDYAFYCAGCGEVKAIGRLEDFADGPPIGRCWNGDCRFHDEMTAVLHSSRETYIDFWNYTEIPLSYTIDLFNLPLPMDGKRRTVIADDDDEALETALHDYPELFAEEINGEFSYDSRIHAVVNNDSVVMSILARWNDEETGPVALNIINAKCNKLLGKSVLTQNMASAPKEDIIRTIAQAEEENFRRKRDAMISYLSGDEEISDSEAADLLRFLAGERNLRIDTDGFICPKCGEKHYHLSKMNCSNLPGKWPLCMHCGKLLCDDTEHGPARCSAVCASCGKWTPIPTRVLLKREE